jgi:hypothetical protein
VDVAVPAALAVFPSVLASAGGWPAARVVLYDADDRVAGALGAAGFTAGVPLAAGLDEACALLELRPRRVRRSTWLPAGPDAAAFCRSLIRAACLDWSVDPDTAQAAVIVGNELVSNAVQHAPGASRLVLTADDRGLGVAVHDPGAAVPLVAARGYGLGLVEAQSSAWGVTRHVAGKTVWALLRGPAPGG